MGRMQGTLILTILNIKSSYLDNLELPAAEDETPDWLYWWVSEGRNLRVKTFAIDHDIHIHSFEAEDVSASDLLALNEKNYGDVIASHYVFEIKDLTDETEWKSLLSESGIEAKLDLREGLPIFTPGDAEYRTQSDPDSDLSIPEG